MATNYDIDYNDSRFTKVETDKQNTMSKVEQTYSGMIDNSDSFYQAQIDAAKQWEEKQSELQQERSDFAIEKVEQQKAQAKKDYLKEQSGAYVDWQQQSNQYGAEAEQMAASGLAGSGYSESSQVSMYNTYQNRVATARESYMQAVQNYNNAITEARLQNNAALAEIAYNALQKQLELSLEGFQYKNTLIIDKANKQLEVDEMYYQRWQDVQQQINTENALAEQVRQYNESLAEEKRQYNESLAEQKRQHNATIAMQQAQLAEEKRQFDVTQAAKAASASSGGSSSKSSGSSGSSKTVSSGSSKSTSKIDSAVSRGATANAKNKVASLKSMSGMMSNTTSSGGNAIANSVTSYLATGAVNADEAAYMYKALGFDPSKYLE